VSSVINNNWYNLNSTRNYPLDDGASTVDDAGKNLPNTAIADINLRMPHSVGQGAMISSVVVSSGIVSVTFLAINHPITPSIYDHAPPALEFRPLAAVSLPKPVNPGQVYPITPLVDGVFGWIVFGDGIAKSFNLRFSTAQQAALTPKVCRSYTDSLVTSVSKLGSIYELKGVVRLIEGRDVSIRKDNILVDNHYKDAIVLSLKENSIDNVYSKYSGPCAGRPESGTCAREPIQSINGVQPDCDGNINIVFEDPFRVTSNPEDFPGIVAVDYPLGVIDACTKQDVLPSADGTLPNQRKDQCSSSYGDPDANAYPTGTPTGPPSEEVSSSTISPVSLPFGLTFDEGLNSFWQNIQGDFEFSQGDFFPGSSSYSSVSAPSDNVYVATGTSGRNISLWYNSGYKSLIGKRIYAELLLEKNSGYPPNGGLVINYRPNQAVTRDEFFIVQINKLNSAVEILRFNGFGYITMLSSGVSSLKTDYWYRLEAEIEEGIAPGSVRISAKLYDASTSSLLSSGNVQTSLYRPDTGKAGLTSDRCRARFRSFNMELI
jgi:hypothetical protein